MALIAKNDVARNVLAHLPWSRTAEGGFFGGKTYCIGVRVRDIGDAFNFGAMMGSWLCRSQDVIEIGFDKIGTQHYVVFRTAEVTQGA